GSDLPAFGSVGVDAVEDELVDGLLAEVLGDFGTGVVRAKFLLVDVFLEDVTEYVGVDLVVVVSRSVVEMPRVPVEQGKDVREGFVSDANGAFLGWIGIVAMFNLNLVRQE